MRRPQPQLKQDVLLKKELLRQINPQDAYL